MAKELDRLGLPVALITCLVDVGALIGVNRIVTAPAIVHPLGQPSLSLEGERAFRRQVVERALEALRTDVTGRRCFGPTVPDGPCVAWRSTVKLTVQIFDVQSVEFGPRTLLEGHHLVVSREELLDRVGRDPAFAAMDVRLIRPGERKRILNVLGITEPRAKLGPDGEVFPGLLGPLKIAGSGITHVLRNVAVIEAGFVKPSTEGDARQGVLDMRGSIGALSPFSRTLNLVLLPSPAPGVDRVEYIRAINRVGLKASVYLARAATVDRLWHRAPGRPVSENEEGFFVSSRGSAMREKGALNEAARRRSPRTPGMGINRAR